MNHKKIFFLSAAITVALCATSVQATKIADPAIHYRKNVFGIMGWHFGQMNDMIRGKKPFDLKEFQMRAARMAHIAPMTDEAFLPGSDQGAPTEAKPEIWKNPADFKIKLDDFQREINALNLTAQKGDEAAIKEQFGKTAGTCKACHEDYKTD